MIARLFVTLVVFVLALGARADCHRLDEYLEAALIGIEPGRVAIELVLTPGAAVAPGVLASIDRDNDHRVSPPEIEAYGRSVVSRLTLRVDGHRYPMSMTRAECASWDEINEGFGAIRVTTIADAPLSGSGRHVVSFENNYEATSAVYQVNALAPRSRHVTIRAQRRDTLQRQVEIDVDVASPVGAALWALPTAGLALLVLWKVRS